MPSHRTLPAPPYPTPRSWSELLSTELERDVEVRFGRARRQVIVVQDTGEVLAVRMNAVFGEAPPDVAESVAKWMRNGRRSRRACQRLDEWIAEIEPRLGPAREVRLRPVGKHYDLEPIMDSLMAGEFDPSSFKSPRPKITWGRRSSGRPHRSLQLGSFDPETCIIRIHPVLDQAAVPEFFLRYVVFHELLHAALGDEPAGPSGRRPHHGPSFRRAEQAYVDYERALTWQDENIRELMRSARSGSPIRARQRFVTTLDIELAARQLDLF